MSSITNVTPKPPPPPPESIVRGTGQTKVSLADRFGPTIQNHLDETLDRISGDFDGFVQELGLAPGSPEARRLRWKDGGRQSSGLRQFSMQLSGEDLPPELRSGKGSTLTVQLLLGGGVLQVRHNYQAQVLKSKAPAQQMAVKQALKRTVNRAVNPLVATTVSQLLRQKAEQQLRPRLKQDQRLQTQVNSAMRFQTTALIRAVTGRR